MTAFTFSVTHTQILSVVPCLPARQVQVNYQPHARQLIKIVLLKDKIQLGIRLPGFGYLSINLTKLKLSLSVLKNFQLLL